MWSRVWRRQLRLAGDEEFWKGLRGDSVQYAVSPVEERVEPLPTYLVRFLRDVLRRSDEEIAATTREKAQNELNAYYARELRNQI